MPDTPAPVDLAAARQRIERAYTELGDVCAQGPSRRFKMHIPADPERDTDLIISAALNDADLLLGEVEQLRAAIARAREALTAALAAWQSEYEYLQERAERKGYAHDEAEAQAYGTAIEAVTEVLATLSEPAAGAEEQTERTRLLDLIRDLTDAEECWYDHHGGCQAHGWGASEGRCPHARARELLGGEAGEEQTGPLRHLGGNAEDCPACDITTMTYPFLCPAEEQTGGGNG